MRLSIVAVDGAVYVDGVSYSNLDLSFLPADVHALQWYDTYGELEFKRQFISGQIIHPLNQMVTELPDWANTCITVWNDAKLAFEEAERLAAEQAALEQAVLGAANVATQVTQTP